MAGKTYQLQVYTQAEKVFESENVTSITFTADDGSMGVLPNHAPMLAVLGEGPLVVTESAGEKAFDISGGFFEIADNKATILTDSFASGE